MGGEIASCRSKNGIFDRSETIGLHLVPGRPVGHLEIPKCPMVIREVEELRTELSLRRFVF